MTTISGSKLAELTGKSWRTVKQRLSAAGITPVREKGAAHLFDSAAALAAIYDVESIQREGNLDLNAERAALAKVQRERIELELAIQRGEVGYIAELAEHFGGHISRCGARLEQIPDALGQLCEPRIAAIVVPNCRRLIHEARSELAADVVASGEG